jgi:predicted amidophosphoribosyltransferase
MTDAGSFARLVAAALADARALLFPVWCAGCDEPDVSLCAHCRQLLEAAPLRRTVGASLAVRSAASFDGAIARAVRALKEEGCTELARPFGRALRPLVTPGAVLVPLPSSRAALRRRGYAVPELLARRTGLPVRALLRATGRAGDQRALGRIERARNVVGSVQARPAAAGERRPVVLVDDVVTTGATLREAARVLLAVGVDVVGAVTVAATPRRSVTRGDADVNPRESEVTSGATADSVDTTRRTQVPPLTGWTGTRRQGWKPASSASE